MVYLEDIKGLYREPSINKVNREVEEASGHPFWPAVLLRALWPS